jgi:hypothetical protein
MSTRFEQLPNELLLNIFIYFDIRNLFHSFWGVNDRFNNLLHAVNNLSFIMEKNESLLIEIFARQINRLKIMTPQPIDFSQFSNLHTLELTRACVIQMEQIRSDIMPNLVNLSISTPFYISLPLELIKEIFSNDFRLLHQANLNRLDHFPTSWQFQSLSLHSLHITCADAKVISQVLTACPNLFSFHVTFFGQNRHILPPSSSSYNHLLEEFSLYDPYHKLTFDTIQILFLYVPNVKYLFLHFLCQEPFIHLIDSILNRLEQLNRFECDILESPNDQMGEITLLQQMDQCFQRLYCIEKDNGYRWFLTE